jgi:single-strand DNA-binding protein
MYNKVVLIGNLGKDPEVRHLESGSSVARLTLATNENYKDKDGNWQNMTEWHNIVAWRQLAETAERTMKKGSTIFVEGKLKTRSYKDQNGVDRYVTEIEATTLKSLDKKERNDLPPMPAEDDIRKPLSSTSNTTGKSSTQEKNEETPEFLKNDEDDLPF